MAAIAAAVTAREVTSIKGISDRFGIARGTVRGMMEQLGLIGGASNQHKDGGITVRTSPVKKPGKKAQKREKGRQRREAHGALTRAAQLRAEQAASDPAPPADPEQPSDPGPADPPPPGSSDPPRRRKGTSDGGKGRPKARLPGSPPLADLLPGRIKAGSDPASDDGKTRADPLVDLVGAWALPTDFDPVDRLRKLASAPFVEFSIQLQALRALVGIGGSKGKVDWSSITVEQVPEEMRHRLAGMLLPWIDFAELPEVVRVAPPACRLVYRLVRVLPQKAEDAEVVLARWAEMQQELRVLAGEVRVPEAATAPPLELELAAETAYIKPQWEDGAN